jgi:HNH endonuclease
VTTFRLPVATGRFRTDGVMTLDQLQVERFWAKVRKGDGCWIWAGSNDGTHGYGHVTIRGKNVKAHRIAYVLCVGDIPEGLTIDHLCRTPACVNPTHLEPVTVGENTLRGLAIPTNVARRRARTTCRKGHPYDSENTTVDRRGWRGCRICTNEAKRRAWHREQAMVACRQGHPFDEANTIRLPHGRRKCRACTASLAGGDA